MKNYLTLSIWGQGPGRPYDNIYILKKCRLNCNSLFLYFSEGEECIVSCPENISVSVNSFKITKAEEIVWKFYCYGKSRSNETLTTINYKMINDKQIHIVSQGYFKEERIVPIQDQIALNAYGDITELQKETIY